MPTPDPLELAAQIARLETLRVANEYVERFHLASQGLRGKQKIETLAKEVHFRILMALRLRTLEEGERIDGHVLELDEDSLELRSTVFEPTDPEQRGMVPPMTLRADSNGLLEPGPSEGVAPYCLYQAIRGENGAAIVNDVREPTDIRYVRRGARPGGYDVRPAPAVFARCLIPPNYRALLCTAVPRVLKVGAELADPYWVQYRHVLCITSSRPNAFSLADVTWVEGVASLLGSLYASRLAALAPAKRKKS